MGILDYYLQPKLLEIESNKDKVREEHLAELSKNQLRNKKRLCTHEFHYEKWIHKARKSYTKDTFHFKQVCRKCSYKHSVVRTKALYELLKNDKWHFINNNK